MHKLFILQIKHVSALMAVAGFALCLSFPTSINAQNIFIPPGPGGEGLQGCATNTWIAMVNQGVLEARRENLMHQRYIAKPDSILEYTCFNEQVELDGIFLGPVFSETDEFVYEGDYELTDGEASVLSFLGFDSLDAHLVSAVQEPVVEFMLGSFDHGLLGETEPVAARGESCNIMANVWQASKCKNFGGPTEFYTFEDLIDFDPREYPEGWDCE